MKFLLCIFLFAPLSFLGAAEPAAPPTGTVVLDATGVRNLRLETVTAEATTFEETVFTLGRIEPQPGQVAAVSSLISGRVVALAALPGDDVLAGAELVKVESRQPGNPAPIIGLKAPLTGVVTQLDVRLGDPVEPERALLEITNLDEVLAIARVPENFAGKIAPGAKAHIRLPALAGVEFEGQLQRFGTAANATSGTLDAFFVLKNPGHRIRPGMRAEFSIVLSARASVVSVPRSAVQGEPTARFVYVKDFDVPNAFVKTPVVTGQSNDRFIEIVSGLLPADEVVTQGAYSLAFAGPGSLSLKEALDAAHGHAHNADGSELASAGKNLPSDAVATTHAAESNRASSALGLSARAWMFISGVLLILVLLLAFRRPVSAPVRS